MSTVIKNPKVFISYAWGDDHYNDSVISFATKLKQEGINVIFDRWHLLEGQDTKTFMEKSVSDEAVTNILILIDPIYATKADKKCGGVGTETQIISPEVYEHVDQTKVIPIIFKRGDDGEIHKPIYLRSRLHFDLTDKSTYISEYQRLIKRLYGISAVPEPELGEAPNWLNDSVLKNSNTNDEFKSLIIEFVNASHLSTESDMDFLENDNRVTHIIELSSQIKTRLNCSNPFFAELEKLIDTRIDNFIFCRETCLCIRDCGKYLGAHTMNSEVVSNLHFLFFFVRYASEKGYNFEINDYIGNEDKVIDDFVEVLKTPEGTDSFLDYLFYSPDKIILNMQKDKLRILEILNKYINSN